MFQSIQHEHCRYKRPSDDARLRSRVFLLIRLGGSTPRDTQAVWGWQLVGDESGSGLGAAVGGGCHSGG